MFLSVKDGEFRQFRGSRNVKDFLDYVEEKQWQNTEPISSWQSPGSFQMGILGKIIHQIDQLLANFPILSLDFVIL